MNKNCQKSRFEFIRITEKTPRSGVAFRRVVQSFLQQITTPERRFDSLIRINSNLQLTVPGTPKYCTRYTRVLYPVHLFFLAILLTTSVYADDQLPPISYPPAPGEEMFTALRKTSPFLRTLNVSETYALRAVATYQDIAYARVYNRETKKTITIEVGGEPKAGLELIRIMGPQDVSDLSGVAARISFAGEEAELKYDPEQLNPANRGGKGNGPPNGKSGKGGGDKKGPTSQEREKYHSLSEDGKNKLKAYIKATVQKYPKMPREERGNLIRGALQKLSDGRELEIPK